MSVLNFKLTTQHLALLKSLNWSEKNGFLISTENPDEDKSPFGGDDVYQDIDLILYGKPNDFDPFSSDEPPLISDEKKTHFDQLLSELPIALEIVLRTQNFEAGDYYTKYHQRYSWKMRNQQHL